MIRSLFALLISIISISVYADPSFNCAKASTNIEKMICADKYLGDLDGLLAQDYKGLFSEQYGFDAAGAKTTKAEQKQWLTKRNACMNMDCVVDAYKSRIDEICEIPVVSGVHQCQSWETLDAPSAGAANGQVPIQKTYDVACNERFETCTYNKDGNQIEFSLDELPKYIPYATSGVIGIDTFFIVNANQEVIGLNPDYAGFKINNNPAAAH